VKVSRLFGLLAGSVVLAARAPGGPPAVPDLRSRWENSLGMRFVPVPGTRVLFCIWETRNRDFRSFRPDHDSGAYEGRSANGDNQPAVQVSWTDAKAFCDWLTSEEQSARRIAPAQAYRLPHDWEWSVAVGLKELKGGSPRDKDSRTPGVYPWGRQWPPPKGAGNFADLTAKRTFPARPWKWIDGYDDGFAEAAPVGSFPPTRDGLYDLAGNAWEWCEDWRDEKQEYRVLRGGSWRFSQTWELLASYRGDGLPDARRDYVGFRVVLAASDSLASRPR
jgi:formylglycine-generating enzyme required for sulfatase activity